MSRAAVQGFRAERLAQILAARRLSQVQLAAMAGVSPATVSKWRSGSASPARDVLVRLAGVVNVAPDWFTRAPAAGVSQPLFRSNASAHVAARAMLAARLEWAQEMALALLDYVDYPALNLPVRRFLDPEAITGEDIESAANACRDAWRLGRGPIQDVALAAEGAGILLVREDTGVAQIEGLSAWSEGLNRPLILLSADKGNAYRSRFDLAHEIGHLILHRQIQRPRDTARHKMLEQQAHRFAGAFLLPAERISAQVPLAPTLDDLLLLKSRWGVSVAAIIMRLKALELIDDAEATLLFKRRSARWGAKSEPGDDDRTPEQPRVLQRTLELLVEERVMPLASIPGYFGLSALDVESLAGLPAGYFAGGKDNVIAFSRLKPAASLGENRPDGGAAVVPFRTP